MTETEPKGFWIDGGWAAPATSERIQLIEASTGDPITTVPAAGPADVDAAVGAARRAFDDPTGWAHWTAEQRRAAITSLADALTSRGEAIAKAVSTQNGMPISISSVTEAVMPAMLLNYYAELAEQQPVEEKRTSFTGGTTLVRRTPVGVVAAIVPWNFPQTLTFFKLAPLLAAGCTAVIKPSPETVLDSYLLAEAIEESDIPAGVVNIVPGGRETGAYLVEHPGVDKVAFTGSTAAGRAIGEACGRLIRPVTLELGGKSASIILDDADLPALLEQFFAATLMNNGQTCYLGTRVLAPRSRYAETVDILTDFARSLKVGNALDAATQIGPLATENQQRRVQGYIEKGRAEGGRITTGGGRPADLDRGWFVEPTVFADVANSHTIAREEIFGPVLTVIPYTDVDEAVAIANDSEFGLGGSVWTSDPERGVQVARRVQTGSIGVNNYTLDFRSPFGGVKASGLGRELGPEGLAAYQQLTSIFLA
ncbi:aldehyde dehydrogenase [Mycolicibacterium thermoresistibile]|uniref:Aldehyde dehydrogenase n=2 Tax=Mycolicibacterium thermoresistibile TaxID=1797 RepID=G7CAZ8_MYCT3|nr:aldehyde dehydrogenase [Mycolicibacterium thermoresistibile]EHI14852.1 aldehyde dehydrogenase [Mycolicibacterium thermoresistibile ATCC 19527]MCV7190821.1 aldehyde dehydrogenase [Mycolicibacterium thermoresistibile]GAT16202.1 aldehyde dehydrogenase [Mycolicibacterium thermoresistibile]SNW18660.1 NAD-dependent aldehyde dehydrogenase [Mycolicibacterium thermoresistibile]